MKVLKTLLLMTLVLVALVLIGLGVFLTTFDINAHKDQIIARIKADTGRDLVLDGPLELALWPKIRLQAGPLTVSNVSAVEAEPLLRAERIQIAVATWPLLRRRVEMDTVVLHGLHLNLARDAAGVGNWADLINDEGKARDAQPEQPSGGQFAALILGGVDIKDGQFTWHDAVTGQQLSLTAVTATSDALSFGAPVTLKVSATARANQPALDADLNLSATLNYNVDDQRYDLAPLVLVGELRGAHLPGGSARLELSAGLAVDLKDKTATLSGLKFDGLGTRVTGEFSARDIEDERPSANGQLAIKVDDLAVLFNAFDLPAGTQLARMADRSLRFDSAFDANLDSGEVRLTQLEGQLLGAQLNGAFTASGANTNKPRATGNLQAHGPDLPSVLIVLAQLKGADAKTQKQLNQALAHSRDPSFDINVDVDIDLEAGRAALPRLDAKLLGDTLSGKLLANNAASKQPAIQGEFKASGADFPALLAVVAASQGKNTSLAAMAQSLARESDKRFSFESGFDADLARGTIALSKLSAEVGGLTLSGALRGEDVDLDQQRGTIDGRLTIESTDSGPWLRALGQGEMARSVQSIKLEAGIQGGLDDMRLNPLTVIARMVSPDSPQPVDLKLTAASAHANLKAQTASLSRLAVTGLGLNAQLDIEAEQIMSKPHYHGSLNIPSFNLRSLLKSLNKPVPKTADARVLGALALNTRFTGSTADLKLDALEVTLDDSHLTGDVNVVAFSGPQLNFALAVDGIDADRYLEAPAKNDRGAIVTPDVAVAGAANALPVEALRTLKAKGAITVGALKISGAKLKDLSLEINATKGLVKLEPLAAQLYDGRYGGGVVLDARGKQTTMALNTRLDKVQIAPLLRDLKDNNSLAGVMSFDAALQAVDGRAAQVKQTLGGTGRFGIREGIFRGVDAVAILRAVEQIIECRCVVAVPTGGQTQFKSLDGSLTIKQGVVRNQDLVMNGEGFTIKGRGTLANLNDNSLKYDLLLAVSEQRSTSAKNTYQLGGYEVPIACHGQLNSPTCLPDFAHILGAVAKDAAKKKIEKAVGKKLKGVLEGKQGDALKNLLKF